MLHNLGTMLGLGFNPRPCVRGDSSYWQERLSYSRFNPRPCVRGDLRR